MHTEVLFAHGTTTYHIHENTRCIRWQIYHLTISIYPHIRIVRSFPSTLQSNLLFKLFYSHSNLFNTQGELIEGFTITDTDSINYLEKAYGEVWVAIDNNVISCNQEISKKVY